MGSTCVLSLVSLSLALHISLRLGMNLQLALYAFCYYYYEIIMGINTGIHWPFNILWINGLVVAKRRKMLQWKWKPSNLQKQIVNGFVSHHTRERFFSSSCDLLLCVWSLLLLLLFLSAICWWAKTNIDRP